MDDILRTLQGANPHLDLLSVEADAFRRYGRLLTRYDASAVIAQAKMLLPSSEGVVYEPSIPPLEEKSCFLTAITQEVFGGMPVQVGWCYGQNLQMSGLEYHKGSEVNVCLSDLILLVGDVQDVVYGEEIRYDTEQVAAFYAPAGSVVEFFPWNLHFAPIHVRKGGSFAALVYLPRGTNEPLPFAAPRVGESKLLFAVNKWLIVHPGATELVAQGAYAGMLGDDILIEPV